MIVGAFIVWIAFAGLNIGLDNIKLKLAPAENNAPYLAVYHAFCDIANGLAIVAGGMLLDRLTSGGSQSLRLYSQLFFWGWIARTLSVALLVPLPEPGAKRLRDLV